MPAWSIASMKGSALPSITGTSGPSTSIMQLSISMPRSVASRCSIVATEAPDTPIVVHRSVALT